MRKLKPISVDALEFINGVISSTNKKGKEKTDEFHNSCSVIVSKNEHIIKLYDKNFDGNTLENLEGEGRLYDDEKKTFKDLYSPDNDKISYLKHYVLSQNGHYINRCPLCECDYARTIDHYLPKDDYTLFIVHPRNLIPCCSTCNNHKKERVFDNGRRMYWNCYIDEPIKKRYLKCTIKELNKEKIDVVFSIDPKNLSDDEEVLIRNTMDDLKILSRYNEAAFEEIEDIIKKISNNMYPDNSFEKSFIATKKTVLPININNNWRDVLHETLFNSKLFEEYAKNESKKIVEMIET